MTDIPNDPTQPPATPPPPPPPPPDPWGQPSPQPGNTRSGGTNGFAVASLVLGILQFFCVPLIGTVLALVFGFIGRNQIDQSGGAQGGRGMAVAGIVLGFIGVALTVVYLIAAVASS
jgi:Domain of unknown function (DUF4190)